jgi:hypothetical protein
VVQFLTKPAHTAARDGVNDDDDAATAERIDADDLGTAARPCASGTVNHRQREGDHQLEWFHHRVLRQRDRINEVSE